MWTIWCWWRTARSWRRFVCFSSDARPFRSPQGLPPWPRYWQVKFLSPPVPASVASSAAAILGPTFWPVTSCRPVDALRRPSPQETRAPDLGRAPRGWSGQDFPGAACHVLRGEAEPLPEILERRRSPEAPHSPETSPGPDVAIPPLADGGLDREARRKSRRKDKVPVVGGLSLEQLPARKAYDAGRHRRFSLLQHLLRFQDQTDLGPRRHQDQ